MTDDLDPAAAPYLPAVVAAAARRFGDRPAFVDPDGTPLSYADLHTRSDEVAAGMARAGVRAGSVVALTLVSDTAYVLAYLAAAKLGAATAGINPRLAPPEQARCLEIADPALVLADRAEVERLAITGGTPETIDADPDRPTAVVFTSGTTGQPKGAWFTDRQLTAVTRIDAGTDWGDGPLPMLAATQFAHVGFTTKLPWYLRKGATTHVLERWRSSDVLDVVERERLPTIGGVAPQIALLLRDPSLDERDLSCVQAFIVGGAASPPAMVQEARRRFDAAYSIRYSSTESGGLGTGTAFDADDEEALHTVGRPWRGVELDLRDEDGRPAERDGEGATDVGEVWLRSPVMTSGYWRDPEGSAELIVDGWLRTGDLGRLDHRGCLVLVGRSKEMFIRGGYNVFPVEVEAVLLDHPGVRAVAVVPRPDDVMGEVGVAVVVPTDPASPPTLEDLRAHGAERLAKHKLPEAMAVVDELPLTAMQKLDRRGLAARVNGA